MWDLIVSVPDHCLSFYFSNQKMRSPGACDKYLLLHEKLSFVSKIKFCTL